MLSFKRCLFFSAKHNTIFFCSRSKIVAWILTQMFPFCFYFCYHVFFSPQGTPMRGVELGTLRGINVSFGALSRKRFARCGRRKDYFDDVCEMFKALTTVVKTTILIRQPRPHESGESCYCMRLRCHVSLSRIFVVGWAMKHKLFQF